MALNIASARTPVALLFSSILLLLIASSSSTSFGNVLRTGDRLTTGGFLLSGNYKFTLQTDCNLVLYNDNKAIWSSNTAGKSTNCMLVLQSNGELLIYSGTGTTVWRSETGGGYGNYALVLQPNGNVVVYGSAVWSTGALTQTTANHPPPMFSASVDP